MERQDKFFRQRINELHTPPPQTQWTPGRTWDRLEGLIQDEKAPGKQANRWYVATAAVLALLLIPAGWLWLPKERESGRREVYTATKTPQPGLKKATPLTDTTSLLSVSKRSSEKRPPRNTLAFKPSELKRRVAAQSRLPESIPDTTRLTPVANSLETTHPLPNQETPTTAIAGQRVTAPVEGVKSYLAAQAVANQKNEPVTITLTFPGRGDSAEATFSRETAEPRRSKSLRILINRAPGEPEESVSESANIFSILTEKKQ